MIKKIVLIAFVSLITNFTFGQKIESDGFSVEYKKYEITEQEVPMFGKQKMIMGTFVIKKEGKKIATHDFLIPIMEGEISHIAVLDDKGKKIFPRLHYIVEEKAYTYNEGSANEGKETAIKTGDQKEIVLSGLLIWAKLTYK